MNSYFVTSNDIKNGPSSNLNITHADGDYLYTPSKKYLDLRSGLWNVSLGYNKELTNRMKARFDNVLDNQIPYIDINSYDTPDYNLYASSLLGFMNDGVEKSDFKSVTFTNSGSEGVEIGVKISQDFAKHVKKEGNKIIVFKNSYHGTFFGSMSVSHKFFGLEHAYETANNVIIVDPPINEQGLNNILNTIETNHLNISSFIIEPILGSGGSISIASEYLEEIVSFCKKYEVLTIFDEVSTGFYRTGDRFAHTSLKNKPNVVILSKSINNGALPFGAVIIDDYTYRCLEKQNINHFSTQSGNVLGISSAITTLEYYIENEQQIKHNVQEIEKLVYLYSSKYSVDITGKGAMFSIPINELEKVIRIRETLKNMGILVYIYENIDNTSGITIHPNLLINQKKLEMALNILFRKVAENL